ncbi:MAG: complex I NDUFA9 subunit family protein [Acidocella sp.]|nr:complex I NDUFA9 subunit family protein [Acidocella sp.]
MSATRRVATVFGASGFIGRYVVKRLADQGYIVRLALRDVGKASTLRPMGSIGQIVPLYAPLHEETLVARATEGAEVVVNLNGILAEAKAGDFMRVHAEAAGRIARLAASSVARHFIHVSAIGADASSPSLYARSKYAGEQAVRAAFADAVILRPSIVFGAEDQFFNRFAAMAMISPVIPLVGGAARFQPVYVGDVADAVMAVLQDQAAGQIFELGGPDIKTFRALITDMLALIERNRMLLDLPLPLARIQAAILERLPGKLLTRDQIKLLQRDNIVAAGVPGLPELGITPTPMALILPGYLARYRKAGRSKTTMFKK